MLCLFRYTHRLHSLPTIETTKRSTTNEMLYSLTRFSFFFFFACRLIARRFCRLHLFICFFSLSFFSAQRVYSSEKQFADRKTFLNKMYTQNHETDYDPKLYGIVLSTDELLPDFFSSSFLLFFLVYYVNRMMNAGTNTKRFFS